MHVNLPPAFCGVVQACWACAAEMVQFASGVPGDRHHLKAVPLLGDTDKTVDITVCQRPDGSDWLLGAGSSGKVQCPELWACWPCRHSILCVDVHTSVTGNVFGMVGASSALLIGSCLCMPPAVSMHGLVLLLMRQETLHPVLCAVVHHHLLCCAVLCYGVARQPSRNFRCYPGK